MIGTEAIQFDEDTLLLEPCKEVAVFTFEFYVAEAAVAQHVTADANM